jgi:uncharacterized protein (TIGR00730 family)
MRQPIEPRPGDQAEEHALEAAKRDMLAEFDRAYRVFRDMIASFRELQDLGPAVTMYGSARLPEGHPHYELARATGAALARAGYAVITGGGPGIMEAGNRGAREAGGLSLGFNIVLPHEQGLNPYVDRTLTFDDFFVRKLMLRRYSQGFILMPGGLGTLDEIFETATLIQCGKLARFPIVLMGKEYWQPIADSIREVMLTAGTVGEGEIELFRTDSPDEAVQHVRDHAPDCITRLGPPGKPHALPDPR